MILKIKTILVLTPSDFLLLIPVGLIVLYGLFRVYLWFFHGR